MSAYAAENRQEVWFTGAKRIRNEGEVVHENEFTAER